MQEAKELREMVALLLHATSSVITLVLRSQKLILDDSSAAPYY
jgi:hypothetical protein